MSGGTDGVAALVLAGNTTEARNVAAVIEAEDDGVTAVIASSLAEAVDRLERTDLDGIVASPSTLDVRWREMVTTLREADAVPLVVDASGVDASANAVLESGATDVVEDPTDESSAAVLANRLRLAIRAAEAERTAEEARHRYHRLLEASPAAIVIVDEDGTIQYANPAGGDLFGAEDAYGIVGLDLFGLVASDWLSVARDRFARIVEDRESVEPRELGFESLDGEIRHAEVAGSPVTVDGVPGGQIVLVEVTELKERERRLRTERDRFTALFESLPEPAVHVRYDDGVPMVRNVNTAFVEGFGYEPEAVVGESINDFVVPGGRDEEARELDRLTAEGGTVERELRRATAEEEREFIFRAQPVESSNGASEGVGIYVDVTDRIRREEALERQNERLDTFASIVSHDLKSPLSIARGNLDLVREVQDGALPEDDAAVYVGKTESALDRMERIIDDLLRLARRGEEGVEPEPLDGTAVVAEAWTEAATDGGVLENELGHRLLADRGQLRELLANLLRNAVEHGAASPGSQARQDDCEQNSSGPRDTVDAGGGGSTRRPSNVRDEAAAVDGADVTVEVGPIDDAPATGSDRDSPERGNGGGFYVADDGPGIAPDERDVVFDPGYTTSEDGTGFGLVLVEEIAGAHGWSVSVTESESGGARFEITGVEFADDE